jgi:enoyl-CoA hydratase
MEQYVSLRVDGVGSVAQVTLVGEILELDTAPLVKAGLRYVAAWNAAFRPSEDFAEAVRAFSERRPPQFTGR